jgi:ubiquinone/menaquinone biosynthesis C-methylase UbiE
LSSLPADLKTIKEKMKATWMAGDFGQIARHNAKAAAEFVERLKLIGGMRVLDVACGTGNLAIPAARTGANITGVDIAANLVQQAKERAAAEGVSAKFDEGDAEQLPYPDSQFDVVMSMFGAMFAPRPDVVASELLRVCKPGGTIAMANWTPRGFVGKMFALSARHVPPPPGIPAPVLWGDEATVRQRFGNRVSKLEMHVQPIEFRYEFTPSEVVEFFRTYFGPTRVAFSKLDAEGQKAFAADLTQLWADNNLGGGASTVINAEYLDVRSVKAK